MGQGLKQSGDLFLQRRSQPRVPKNKASLEPKL